LCRSVKFIPEDDAGCRQEFLTHCIVDQTPKGGTSGADFTNQVQIIFPCADIAAHISPEYCRIAESISQAPKPGETPEGLSNRQIDPPGPRAWGNSRRAVEPPNRSSRPQSLGKPPEVCRIAESTSQAPIPGDAPEGLPNRRIDLSGAKAWRRP
jgi:hypothetical protein